jgi:hypothetical protein
MPVDSLSHSLTSLFVDSYNNTTLSTEPSFCLKMDQRLSLFAVV